MMLLLLSSLFHYDNESLKLAHLFFVYNYNITIYAIWCLIGPSQMPPAPPRVAGICVGQIKTHIALKNQVIVIVAPKMW